jgi:hypothetical protein
MSQFAGQFRKDESLDRLAESVNVAQFVSFRPGSRGAPEQTFARVNGEAPSVRFPTIAAAAERLLERSSEGRVNVRSFVPGDNQSKPFVIGLRSVAEVEAVARQRLAEGLWFILNETIDPSDGGFSGVADGELTEFAADDTPRAVEAPGTCALPRAWTEKLVEIVYGHKADLSPAVEQRFEFSVHPKPRGWRNTPVIGWELGPHEAGAVKIKPQWPNRYSRFLGDKAFGLLMAHLAGAPVPETTVYHRRLARPFSFGKRIDSSEVWVRSSPREQGLDAGKYRTVRGWTEPFALLTGQEAAASPYVDPDTGKTVTGFILPSAVVQKGVPALWSGKSIVQGDGTLLASGIRGRGDVYMRGKGGLRALPSALREVVARQHRRLNKVFGPVEFEWAYDGTKVWVLQLHLGRAAGVGDVLVPGEPAQWVEIAAGASLDGFRQAATGLAPDQGILVRGRIGLTSHKADLLRRAGRPAKLVPIA